MRGKVGSGNAGKGVASCHLYGISLHFEVNAGDLAAAILVVRASALAELCKTDVTVLAKFET